MRDVTVLTTIVHDLKGEEAFVVRTYERDSSAMVVPPSRFRVTTLKDRQGDLVEEESSVDFADDHLALVKFAYGQVTQKATQ